MDYTLLNSGFLNNPKNNDMRKFLIIPFCVFCFKFACSQNVVDYARVDNIIFNKTWNLIIDTVPASIPSDYFDFCGCMGVSTLANIYSFEDIYRGNFSYKTPAKYLLSSIVQLDSVGTWGRDSALCVVYSKAIIYETFFSPYYLNYWTPKEDVLESEYISGSKTTYDYLLDKIKDEKEKKTEKKNIDVIIIPEELSTIKNAVNNIQSNLFLLRINDSEEGDIIAYQFFTRKEFNISSLYTPLQYYKYLLERYSGYMKKRGTGSTNINNRITDRKH